MIKLPAVGTLVNEPIIQKLCNDEGREIVLFSIRKIINKCRQNNTELSIDEIIELIINKTKNLSSSSLQPVINATGIVLHTNLGRAPLGEKVLNDISPIVKGYSNLEFNLNQGKRGHRNYHLNELLQIITGAEEAVVVNNTAAALILILSSLSTNKDVIVSRGELIEIGGSFRIPQIMEAANVNMREIGTTNRTRISDYKKEINENTGILFKAHLSNFKQTGFTEEASIQELVKLSKKSDIPFVYDIGSGLLRKPNFLKDIDEPVVQDVIKMGCEIVTFSTDKLLGGPQGGIIAGKSKYIKQFIKAPLMRALRPCKLSIAALESACRNYLDEENLLKNNPSFSMLNDSLKISKKRSAILKKLLQDKGIKATIINGEGQSGGGTLPDTLISTKAVQVNLSHPSKISKKIFHDKIHTKLMQRKQPVISVLRQGSLIFETLTTSDHECQIIPAILLKTIKEVKRELNYE